MSFPWLASSLSYARSLTLVESRSIDQVSLDAPSLSTQKIVNLRLMTCEFSSNSRLRKLHEPFIYKGGEALMRGKGGGCCRSCCGWGTQINPIRKRLITTTFDSTLSYCFTYSSLPLLLCCRSHRSCSWGLNYPRFLLCSWFPKGILFWLQYFLTKHTIWIRFIVRIIRIGKFFMYSLIIFKYTTYNKFTGVFFNISFNRFLSRNWKVWYLPEKEGKCPERSLFGRKCVFQFTLWGTHVGVRAFLYKERSRRKEAHGKGEGERASERELPTVVSARERGRRKRRERREKESYNSRVWKLKIKGVFLILINGININSFCVHLIFYSF